MRKFLSDCINMATLLIRRLLLGKSVGCRLSQSRNGLNDLPTYTADNIYGTDFGIFTSKK